MEHIGELTRRGLAAAARLAQRLGLPGDDPVILSSRGNLLVHLSPALVVARVATLTARYRLDPMAWLAREVAVAGYVAGRGGPVVPPAADPGPCWQDGFAVSLWQYVVTRDASPDPADVGSALGRLHRAARGTAAFAGSRVPGHGRSLFANGGGVTIAFVAPRLAVTLRSHHGTGPADGSPRVGGKGTSAMPTGRPGPGLSRRGP